MKAERLVTTHPTETPSIEAGITVDAIFKDNSSPAARKYLAEWREGLHQGTHDVLLGCADSRLLLPNRGIVYVRTIATAALPEFGATVLGSGFRARNNIIVVHEPCGGLGVKANQEFEPASSPRAYSTSYVNRYVAYSDPHAQGLLTGEEAAKYSGRPTLVAVQSHVSGDQKYLTAFLPINGRMVRKDLSGGEVPAEFQPFLTNYNKAVAEIKRADLNLAGHQQTINPSVVLLTTDLAGLKRFPYTLGRQPNTTFVVTVPATGNYDNLPGGDLKIPFDQTHYAFSHALESHGDVAKPFGRLANGGTLILESDSILKLIFLASEVFPRSYMRDWKEKSPGNNVIFLLSKDGNVTGGFTYDEYLEKFGPKKINVA